MPELNTFLEVKQMDIHNVASKGVANAGLTTGIIGTSLGALNAMGGAGGLLGGLFGGGCNAGCSENVLVNRYELGQAQEIESLKSQIALRDANTFTDGKLLELYRYVDMKLGEVHGALSAQAVREQATKDSFAMMEERLCREVSERKCADNTIVNYANATFYPKLVASVTAGTETTAQAVYNPLPINGCGC